MRVVLTLPWLLVACGGLPIKTVDGTEEQLIDGAVDAVFAPQVGSVVVLRDGNLSAVDGGAARSQSLIATGVGALHDAAPVGPAVLLATDGRLLTWTESGLAESPTGSLLGEAVTAVDAVAGRVALGTDSGVFLAHDGLVEQVLVEGDGALGEGRLDAQGVLWLATDDGALGWSAAEGVVAFDNTAVHDVAVSGDGTAWFATDGGLLRLRRSGAKRFDLPEPAVALHGTADGVWVVTAEHAWRVTGGNLEEVWVGGEPVVASGADRSGRLLLATNAEVRRISVGRPLVVQGLAAGDALAGPTRVRMLPTAADRVTDLSVTLDGAAVTLDADLALRVDPSALGAGEHELSATATWDDGVEDSVTLPFSSTVVAYATWTDDVLPLHQDRCAVCHQKDTATVLDGPEAWQSHFDAILAATTEGRMPLQGAPLEPIDLAVLAAWRDNGFPLE